MNKYMEIAYNLAKKSFKLKEVPVGAVIVKNNKIIAKSYNNRQLKHSVLGHAEINCILKAEKRIKDWRLDDCEMYVTLEPCEMCRILIRESRISKVFYLVSAKSDKFESNSIKKTNICLEIEEKYQKLLDNFFKSLRK